MVNQKEILVDSIYNALPDSAKIGLLLMLDFQINDSNDLQTLLKISNSYYLNALHIETNNFKFHKSISDSLNSLNNLPPIYTQNFENCFPEIVKIP